MLARVHRFFLKDNTVLIPLIISVLLNISLYYLFFVKIDSTRDVITLHYNIFFGIDLLGPWYKVYAIPVLGTFIIWANFLLAFLIQSVDKLLKQLLTSSSIVIQFFLLLAGVLVALFNI